MKERHSTAGETSGRARPLAWLLASALCVLPAAAEDAGGKVAPGAGAGDLGSDFSEKDGIFGKVRPGGYYRLRYYRDLTRDNDTENTDEFRSDFLGELKSEIGDGVQVVVSGKGQHDLVDNGRDGKRAEQESIGIWEAYLKARTRSIDLWLGKQVIRWGKSDELNPTDNFTPEDYSEFINQDRVDRKIPVWMLRGDYYWEDFTYELVFLPFFVPSPNIPRESDWYMSALRSLEASGLMIDENEPEQTVKNCVVANKLCYHSEGFDASVSYASHYNEVAALEIRPPRAVFGYHRQNSVGADFELTTGEVGIRGEGVYTTEDPFATTDPTDADGVKYSDTVTLVVGADHTFASDVYVNLQYYVRHVLDHRSDLSAEEYDHSLIGTMSRKFLREDLELSVTGRYYVEPEGYYLSPEVKYRINDYARVRAVAAFFGGDSDSFMGQFDKNDQLGLELKLAF